MLIIIAARMATAAMPSMAMAITSSIRVSPASPWGRVGRLDMSDIDLTEDPVHRRDQRDRDEPDHGPHRDDDERLEERCQLRDLVVELGLVVLRGDLELRVEGAGVLSDTQHLRRGPREQFGACQWTGNA